MILKMWNEITESYVIVDNVESVSTNLHYTLRSDNNNVEAVLSVYKPIGTPKEATSADLLKGSWIPSRDASKEIKSCDDFYLSRNINSVYEVDYVLTLPNEKYEDQYDATYTAKIILVNAYSYTGEGKSQASYLLPCKHDCPVYLLNNEGKTIERI